MLQVRSILKTKLSATSSNKEYSLAYQKKLDEAILDAKKSNKVQSVKDFLLEVRTW